MKRTKIFVIMVVFMGLALCLAQLTWAAPMGTAYTYQGRLIEGDEAGDGLYDFEFKLFDDPCTGTQQGSTINIDDLDVIDGYFTTELDFGAAFDGNARWLEIAVRPGASVGPFTILVPRQEVTPTPYAIYAQSAEDANTVDGLHSTDLAMRIHSHSAESITSGTLSNSRFSAHSDLITENYLGNATGDLAQNNGVLQINLNADMLDGLHSTSFLTSANDYGRSGVSSNLYEGTTPLVNKYLGITATAANANLLDGLDSTNFASSGHSHNSLYYTESESDSRFVNVTGDTMTGSLDATYSGALIYAMKGTGQLGPTNGYLGVQGQNGYDSITSTYWAGNEIGVLGISTGGSATDNYGVLGHASQAGVRGEYSGDPNTYGELGRVGGYGIYGEGSTGVYGEGSTGVRGEGTSYAGYFLGGSYGIRAQGTSYGTYSSAVPTGTSTAYGIYGRVDHSANGAGTAYGTYSRAYGSSGTSNVYGTYSYSSKVSTATGGTGYGGYFTADNDSPGNSYGIYTRAIGSGGGTNYGIYAYASGGTTNYAGYFSGDVRIVGSTQLDLLNGSSEPTIEIMPYETTSTDGSAIYMYNSDQTKTIEIDADAWNGGSVYCYNTSGTSTVQIHGDYSSTGDGRVITDELQITGGSDLSEQFDIRGAKDDVKPGMLVSIDPTRPGKLLVSNASYDKKVAGIISGAGGVKPGMMMGQKGSKADGDYPVALTGRVYCWSDASNGAIEPGDLLTTSSTPGHAMKASNHNKALGAIIGKAMTPLEKGKGLVLVLVSLQ